MRTNRGITITLMNFVALLLAFVVCLQGYARDTNDLKKRASWQPMPVEQGRQQLDAWLSAQKVDEAAREKINNIWSAPWDKSGASSEGAGGALLERVVASIGVVEPGATQVIAKLQSDSAAVPAKFPFLFDEQTPAFVRFNLRLAYGRWLAQQSYFDDALEQLSGLKPENVVDPAALLFYQSVAFHRLLKKEECIAALDKLLENESLLPRRYVTVAKLMDADIRPLETDSLDEIARLMSDIRRRLSFGHAGKRVRQQEDDVIAKLDKKIKEIEDQMQKMPSGGQGPGGTKSSNPAEDSQNLGGRGQGDVDQKDIGNQSGWGNLPPKEREQALQQISKDLPAYYREAIEEYFRKLARENDK